VQTADIGTNLIDRLFFNDEDAKDDDANLLENLKT
jgi:serine/threonine protein kinase